MTYIKKHWESNVTPLSADNMNNIENGIEENKNNLTPVSWTTYSIYNYQQTDAGANFVWVIGKICIFSISFMKAGDTKMEDTQVFVQGMPKPAHDMFGTGTLLHGSATEAFKFKIAAVENSGVIRNWYSGANTYTYNNQPVTVSGMYVIE